MICVMEIHFLTRLGYDTYAMLFGAIYFVLFVFPLRKLSLSSRLLYCESV